ncbi:NIPSNAP family containing protein [Planctomonas sp. JC2975]|uniref:NIPSNAP family protein n=1 Tax=Planctomonas sp. JC2975 TaxID=2729626 RepID=UPI001473F9BF|nr:NIPSNAP family protein [Planctomonas sp. JC2975]NNC12091.1 NIPSNAP family containing protein [Planctomonas sp. JC2975]
MTIQLRRYQLRPGTLPTWVEYWRRDVAPLRREFGFGIRFASADHANDQFVWALEFDGTPEELAEQDRLYHASPQWAERNDDQNIPLIDTTIAVIEDVTVAAPGLLNAEANL